MRKKKIMLAAVCGGIVLLPVLITYLVQKPVYWFIDDIRMRELIDGSLAGAPDGRCVYIKYIWSSVLACLYRFLPQISWYDLGMTGIMLACAGAILYRGMSLCETKGKKCLVVLGYLLFYLLFLAKNFLYVQFTMVSAMAFMAAYFWYVTQRPGRSRREFIKDFAVCMGFLFFSIVIRTNTFYMLFVFAGISFLYRVMESKEERMRNFLLLAGVAFVVLLVNGVDWMAYRNEGYPEYREFNRARSLVYDYYSLPGYNENYDFYAENEISGNLYEGMAEYSLALEQQEVDADLLEKIADYQKERANQNYRQVWQRVKQGIRDLVEENGYTRTISIFGVSVLLAGMIFCMWKNKKRRMLRYVYITAVAAAEVVYFSYRNRLLEHLLSPVLLIVMATVLADILRESAGEKEGKSEKALCLYLGALGLALVVPCLQGLRGMRKESEIHRQETAYVAEFTEENKDNFYYVDAWLYMGDMTLRLFWDNPPKRNYLVDGGWGTNHPLYQKVLDNAGLDKMSSDLLKSGVYMISPRGRYYIMRYYLEYGIPVKVNVIDQRQVADKVCYVYQVERADHSYPLKLQEGKIAGKDLPDDLSVLVVRTYSNEGLEEPQLSHKLVFPEKVFEDTQILKKGIYDLIYANTQNWDDMEEISFQMPEGVEIREVYGY
ncbi:MAG: hypothetical protein HFH49_13180 [Lachnospiraceae bacterium]|nr:hypothetical protein [Lachnospiraceae bacterium]